jgi:hypothetical protein
VINFQGKDASKSAGNWFQFMTCRSLENENGIMGSDGIRDQELMCWRGPDVYSYFIFV